LSVKRTIRTVVKSCCNSVSYLFETEKPIRKSQLRFFLQAGYLIPDHYSNSGIFYAQKNRLIATASFGVTKISVKCSGPDCLQKLDEFEKLLDTAVNS
jgi:hypothetical protein